MEKISFLKKLVISVIIAILTFGSLGSIFIPKAEAQSTPGAAIGQAVAMGVFCLYESKIEMFVDSLATNLMKALGISQAEVATEASLVFLPGMELAAPYAVPAFTYDSSAVFQAAKQQSATAVDMSKKCIRDVVVKMIMDWLVDQTVQWIQNGGQPNYVTNWDRFASDAFNVGIGEIIAQTKLAWLCEPFGAQVRMALLPVPRYQNRISCTLDDITANIEDFYNDFSNGSWAAYEEQWYPENNFYGASLMAISEAQAKAIQKQQAAEKEVMASKGFIGVKRCVKIDLMGSGKCLEYEIITPGDAVGEVVGKALTADFEWAQNIQSWVAALVNAGINRLFKEGLSSMSKSTAGGSSGSGGSYDPYGGYNPNLVLQERDRDRIQNDYKIFLIYFNAILANKKQSLSSEQQILVILNELKNRNCQPLVSESDITAAQNEITRLTDNVADFQTAVDELNANIAAAQNIKNFTNREVALLAQNYSDFVNKYQFLVQEIAAASAATSTAPFSGATEQFAREEAQTKQNELTTAQNRLNTCIITAP